MSELDENMKVLDKEKLLDFVKDIWLDGHRSNVGIQPYIVARLEDAVYNFLSREVEEGG